MIKKYFASSAVLFIIVSFFVSCASTPKADAVQTPAVTEAEPPVDNPLTHVIQQNMEQTASVPSSVPLNEEKNQDISEAPKTELPKTEEPELQSVDEEDKSFLKNSENAPVTDVSLKIEEPFIQDVFIEPEVIDLPEENNEIEEIPETEVTKNKKEEDLPSEEEKNIISESISESISENVSEQKKSTELSVSKENIEAVTKTEANHNEPSEPISDNKNENSENPENTVAEEELPPEEPEIVPSRTVSMKKNQYLDVVYPGSGWVFIGENSENTILRYFGRRIGTGNTTFSLRSLKAGTTLLHFYKNDALTGKYIDDYLEVTVEDESAKNNTRVKAPSYADIVPSKPERRTAAENKNSELAEKKPADSTDISVTNNKAEEKTAENVSKPVSSESKKDSSAEKRLQAVIEPEKTETPAKDIKDDVKTIISTPEKNSSSQISAPVSSQVSLSPEEAKVESSRTQSVSASPVSSVALNQIKRETSEESGIIKEEENITADESLLERALKLFDEKKYEESLNLCQIYVNGASTRLDEAYYLLGQLYESESSIKNIRNSVDAYNTVTKKYPLSKLWKKANQRSIYLKRFYIDIR